MRYVGTWLGRLALGIGLMVPGVVWAQADSGDTAWVLTAAALVLLMTVPGLSLFYGGLVRSKNVLSILLQCFSIACVASLVWLVAGYSLAFGTGGPMNAFIGDLNNVMLAKVSEAAMSGSLPEGLFVLFQMTFAVITPALIIGGFAERTRFSAVLLFTAAWSLLVYAPVCHWVWGGGWLGDASWYGAGYGLLDFAGGVVVHVTAGVAALVAAIYIGPRVGFLTTPMMPHNMTLVLMGAGMLWVGWFGFNGGSALTADGNAAMAMLVTHISACAAALIWMGAEWVRYGKPSALGAVTGMVAGLGTITPGSGFVGPGGALVIGLVAGLVCFFATNLMKMTLKVDDSLDVFPVHGVGGALGTIAVAVFASSSLGVFSGQGDGGPIFGQLGLQVIGVVAVVLWTAVMTWLVLVVVNKLVGVRVSADDEAEGLDIAQHNESGYVDL